MQLQRNSPFRSALSDLIYFFEINFLTVMQIPANMTSTKEKILIYSPYFTMNESK